MIIVKIIINIALIESFPQANGNDSKQHQSTALTVSQVNYEFEQSIEFSFFR